MAPPKRYWVKLKVPASTLSKLPDFPTPISKSRLKKIAAEERRAGGHSHSLSPSERSSPAPEETASRINPASLNNLVPGGGSNSTSGAISQFKINQGLKESSTSGLTMNSITSGLYALDKSGKPVRKWIKKPREFKTFSGFKVRYVSYQHKDGKKEKKEKETKVEPESVTPEVKSEA
ncbi:uncharacterized protein SPAPADRAFT_57870 [Spathaspora passalidarum NRRL Y-27907]|uniref:Uncharacterized protein n=1 Tax=Spathaspora passalidarum (strain NRRL Y-27907 / 11-Y1) TaxID=619300 RepID=G3AEZ4_SPAPN|nr:uncharacterized protein SPAPADRAFT_57870 [Spathaspora passalidarum NRRL Y-27907]EGW34798.1 hypothetical protein SPAPADRAFT_57870 [Spathaspora passalidarum NRRL Y-27907]